MNESEDRLRDVEIQLAALNVSLPQIKEDLENAVSRIIEHEGNAAKRWDKHIECMIKRERATDNIKALWGILIVLLTALVGIAFKSFAK